MLKTKMEWSLIFCCLLLGTLAKGDDVLSFISIGDWGDTALPGQAQVSEVMDDWAAVHHPQYILSTGDNFYPWGAFSPTDIQFENKWRAQYNGTYTGDLPWLMSVGNHDYGRDKGEEWNQVEFGKNEPRWILPHLWYNFTYQADDFSVDFIAIDTEALRLERNNYTDMLPWLEERLNESTATWKIVYGHRPVYSVGDYGPWQGTNDRELRPILELEKYDVDVYLCGHDHNLQHLQYEDGKPGIDYVISGAGGALVYRYDADAADALDKERGVVAPHFSANWGFVGFDISKDSMFMDFVNSKGESVYNYTRSKN